MTRWIVVALILIFNSPAFSAERIVFKSYDQASDYVEAHRLDEMPDGYIPILTFCHEDNCVLMQAEILNDVKLAYGGDYQGQRNLAFCLWAGCKKAMIANKQLSCAWRMLILASGSPRLDQGDISNFETCLEKLSTVQKAAMKAQTTALFPIIYGRQIPRDWR